MKVSRTRMFARDVRLGVGDHCSAGFTAKVWQRVRLLIADVEEILDDE